MCVGILFMWYKCVDVYALGTHAMIHTWWPEDNFEKSVLFFHLYVDLNDGTQATRLGSQAPFPAEPSRRQQQQSFMSSMSSKDLVNLNISAAVSR